MKACWSIKTLSILGIMLALVFGAIAPAVPTLAATEKAVLKVTNNSGTTLKLYLTGPKTYNLSVPKGQTRSYDVNRGKYKFVASACGITGTGTLDMSINRNVVMPVCGGRVASSDVHTIDLGQVLRVVKVEVKNKAPGVATAVFKGPALYMVTLKKNADKFYIMAKGNYTVTVYACGETTKYKFTADKGKVFTVTCP